MSDKQQTLLLWAATCLMIRVTYVSAHYMPTVISGKPIDGTWNASISINVDVRHPISSTLFGIFFEEIGHAGEGGLYAELIQDRSFDAIAMATGFLHPDPSSHTAARAEWLPVDLEALHKGQQQQRTAETIRPKESSSPDYDYKMRREYLQSRAATAKNSTGGESPSNNIIIAWQALANTQTALRKALPLNTANLVSMEVRVSEGKRGGIFNQGFWGVALAKDTSYTVSLFIRNPQEAALEVEVALVAADLSTVHATLKLQVESSLSTGEEWKKYGGELVSEATDTDARLAVQFDGPATLLVDSVSLFPTSNVIRAQNKGMMNPWPFRLDLLQALKDLNPGFIRFPGGCYVEGDLMRNAFKWKSALGLNEQRPGHYNLWGYWSTDGLGLFEYMLLAEELGAEPVWVVNSGVAHGDSIPASQAMPLVQDALDSIEFVTGSPESRWGSLRATMGHPEPWKLNYMAIGNEDCGKPFYVENYNLFYGALKTAYPHVHLISNCDMGQSAPTDIWDYHVYTNPSSLFSLRTVFDGRDPDQGHLVFASEYAVTDGGGWGNLVGAVAEAAFMTGLERNGAAVPMAAYAPLFVHWNDRPWPTNLIVINNHQWFGIPSYHVQRLFRATQGVAHAVTHVNSSLSRHEQEGVLRNGEQDNATIAASATCQDTLCTDIVIKVINFSAVRQGVAVGVHGGRAAKHVRSQGQMIVLTGEHPDDENSFENPLKVAPVGISIEGLSESFVIDVLPWSVNALRISYEDAPSATTAVAED